MGASRASRPRAWAVRRGDGGDGDGVGNAKWFPRVAISQKSWGAPGKLLTGADCFLWFRVDLVNRKKKKVSGLIRAEESSE